jgi:S-phase kinase-associated protein 1
VLDEEPVPIQFDEAIVKRVFEFLEHEIHEPLPDIPKPVPSERLSDWIPQWYANFIDIKSLDDLMETVAAANYLDVPSLVELGCAKIGCLMKNKSIPELR